MAPSEKRKVVKDGMTEGMAMMGMRKMEDKWGGEP